jgi:transposase-like protein
MTKVEIYQDQIVELYNSGKTIPQIAEMLPMSRTRVGDVLRKLKMTRSFKGVKRTDPILEKQQAQDVIKLYLEDVPIMEICTRLKKGWRFVQKTLIESGVWESRAATKEEEEEVIRLYTEENKTIVFITEALGRSTPFVKNILKKNKIKIVRRKPIITEEFKKEVIKLYCDQGYTLHETADIIGVDYHKVRKLALELKLERGGKMRLDAKQKKLEENRKLILSLYENESHTVASISKLTKISYAMVRGVILDAGLPIRRLMKTDFESMKIRNGGVDAFTRSGVSFSSIVDEIKESRNNYNLASRELGLDYNTVVGVAKKMDLYVPAIGYDYRTDFFEKIDTHEKAYILGLLASDGNNNTEFNSVRLSLQESDYEIVSKVRDLIAPNKPIKTIIKDNPRFSNMVTLDITNKKISTDLANLGIIANKTFKLKVEDWLSGEFINSAILGFHDGDGSFYYKEKWGKKHKPRTTPEKTWTFSFIGLRVLCEFMQKTFKEVLGINSSVVPHSKYKGNEEKPLCTLRVYGNLQNKTLMDWLYKDCSIFMKRKHDNYLDMLEFLKTKRKNQFG